MAGTGTFPVKYDLPALAFTSALMMARHAPPELRCSDLLGHHSTLS